MSTDIPISDDDRKITSAAGPLTVLNFDVVFWEVDTRNTSSGSSIELCRGSFSEVSGLEATMEPKVIKEGGRNFGAVQRVGPTSFATVILKRGVSTLDHLWKWYELVAGGAYGKRMNASIAMFTRRGPQAELLYTWQLQRALPTKFKTADFNATASAVGIEELHLAHEGMVRW